jgi:hypothetical protein
MIINHRYRFIFLKTRKTGGTSVEIALSRWCGPGDVITPVTDEDEAIRRQAGYVGPQNTEISLHRYSLNDFRRLLKDGRRKAFYNHAPLAFVRNNMSRRIWNSYFKFSIERNPFDKAISRYFWSTRATANPPPIGEFLRGLNPRLLSNWPIYADGDELGVDFMVRFENLQEDLVTVTRRLGIPGALELPRAKGGYRRDRRHYSELLGPDDRMFLEQVCNRELRAFGYMWESPQAREV